MDTNKLAGILAKSKKVMRRADEMKTNGQPTGDYQTMAAQPQAAPTYNISEAAASSQATAQPIKNTFINKDTTKMPKEIVEAMINNPIEQPSLGSAGFEATPDLIEAVRGAEGVPTQQPTQTTTTSTTTNVDGIREIIREELEKVIDQYIDKRLIDEDIQVKVGNTVFSGNLRPLPKKKVRKK